MTEIKIKLRPRVKKLWLEALRSGEYSQTDSQLRNDQGFCCLGVLCDLYRKSRHRGKWVAWPMDGLGSKSFVGKNFCEGWALPPPVFKWATGSAARTAPGSGADLRVPDTDDPAGIMLSQLNDRGKAFEQIADKIEEHL